MIYNQKASPRSKANNLSESDVKKIVLEWYNGMFADILQDEYGRDLEEITRRTKKQLKNY
jgi:hypothetical protein